MSDYKYNKIEVTGNTEGFDINIDCAEGSVEISPATQCEATVRNIDVEGTRQYGTLIVSVLRGFIIAPIALEARLYIEDIERTMYMDLSGSVYVYTPNQEIRISVQGKLGSNTATVSNLQAVADNSSKGLLISTTGSTVVIKSSTATFAESELRNRAITITATVAGQSVSETVYVKTVVHAEVETTGEGLILVSKFAKTCISYIDTYNVLQPWVTEDAFEFDIKCINGVKPTITNAYIRAKGGTEYSNRITLNNIFTLEVDVTDVKLKLSKKSGFLENISGALQYELKLIGVIGPSSVPVEYYYTNGSFPLVDIEIQNTGCKDIVKDENNNIEPNTFTVTPKYIKGSLLSNVYITDIKPLDGNQITNGVSAAIQADKMSFIVTTTNVKRVSDEPIKYILTVLDTNPLSINKPTIYVLTICTLNVKHATVGIASFTNGFDAGSVTNRNIISCVLGSSGTIEYIEVDNTNHIFNPVTYGTIYEMTPSLKTNDNVSIGVESIKPLGIYTDVAKQHSANIDALLFTIETNTISKKVLIRFNYYTSTFTNSNVNDTYYLFYKVTGTKNDLYYVAETYICIKIVDHISIKVSENTLNPLLNQYGRYDELLRFAPIWIKVFDNTETVIPNDNIQGVTLIDRGNALQGLRYEYRNDYTMWFDVNGDTNTVAHESTPYTLDMRINFSVNGNTYYNAELYIVDSGIKDYETIIVPINCAYDVMFNSMDLVDTDCGDYANSSYMIPVYLNSDGVNILAMTAKYTDVRGRSADFPPECSNGGILVPDTYASPYYGGVYPRTNIRMAAPKEFIADFDEYTRITHEFVRGYPIEEAIWNAAVNNFLEDEQDNIKVILKAKDGTVIDSAVQLTIVALSDPTDEGRTFQVYVPSRYTNDPPILITKYEPKNCEVFAIKLKLDNTKSLVNPQTESKITIEIFDDSKSYDGKNLLIITNYVKVGFEYYNPAVNPFNGAWNINAETQPTVRTLTCRTNNSTYGTVKGAGTYLDGSKVYIEAIPSSIKYVFEKWSDNSTLNPYLVTVNADKTYVANFIQNPKYINALVVDTDNRGSLDFDMDSTTAYISPNGIINLKLYYDGYWGNGEYATCSIDKIEVIKTGKASYETDNYITKFFRVSGQFLLDNLSNVSEPQILLVPPAVEQELHTYISGKITSIKIHISLVYTNTNGYIFSGTYYFQFLI